MIVKIKRNSIAYTMKKLAYLMKNAKVLFLSILFVPESYQPHHDCNLIANFSSFESVEDGNFLKPIYKRFRAKKGI